MTTFEERCMAFMNCPWKNTAGCNLACEACIRNSPKGFKGLLDSIERLTERLKALGWKEEEDNADQA